MTLDEVLQLAGTHLSVELLLELPDRIPRYIQWHFKTYGTLTSGLEIGTFEVCEESVYVFGAIKPRPVPSTKLCGAYLGGYSLF